MINLNGKYASATIFTDLVDGASISQVQTLLGQKFVEGSKIRMMPDIHAGAGCTIGTTMTITDAICPNLVGVDIGCGMLVIPLAEKEIDLPMLDDVIRKYVPSGFSKRTEPHTYAKWTALTSLRCIDHVNLSMADLSIGTLGGGNHFIEVDKDDEDNLYLVIHTGSRHLGLEVANYYQSVAGRGYGDLAYLTGYLFDNYIYDMKIIQNFAVINREAIAKEILTHSGLYATEGTFISVHNYIDTDEMILRKGAVSAQKGEKLIIPINMRDGSLICVGKGNPEWNYSAPHGAGRIMSRGEAKRTVSLEEFEASMEGIYSTSVSKGTIDECPMAYKPMESIIENIGDTVDILKVIKPIYNFKANEKEKRA